MKLTKIFFLLMIFSSSLFSIEYSYKKAFEIISDRIINLENNTKEQHKIITNLEDKTKKQHKLITNLENKANRIIKAKIDRQLLERLGKQ